MRHPALPLEPARVIMKKNWLIGALLASLSSCSPAPPAVSAAVPVGAANGAAGARAAATPPGTQLAGEGWAGLDGILARIQPPTFPARDCLITDQGAVAGGKQDATEAIRKAIAACSAQGGGRVVVPPGVFLTGAIHLESNINLHVSEGATLRFSADPAQYLPVVLTRWEGIECMNYSPLIYALDRENVAVTGTGTLDGSASDENWWKWTKRQGPEHLSLASPDAKTLNAMALTGVPVPERVFGAGHYLRPNFIVTYRSKNVLIEGVTLVRSPMWEVHPVLSTNVTVRDLKIVSHGPNNDGCDPDSSRDVLIDNVLFDVGDDCIAIKSGRNEDGRRVNRPSENIIVRNSTMKDGHAGVAIGSEISAGGRNIFIENDRMDSPHLARALRLKSNARRGGVIENVFMRNVVVGKVAEALLTVDFLYEEGPNGTFPPTVRNISIENVKSSAAPRLFHIRGFEGATIEGIRVADSEIRGVTETEVIDHAGRIELERVSVMPLTPVRSASSRVGPP
jgi:unsaturated rhamnogalacturonyl hydrolase